MFQEAATVISDRRDLRDVIVLTLSVLSLGAAVWLTFR
jgi:hypothetical protein